MSINQIYDYHYAGFRVFALWEIGVDGKCQCNNPECIAPGKHPRNSNWGDTPYQSDEQIDNVYKYVLSTGFGVCLDKHHLVIDIDPRGGGDASFRKLCEDLSLDLEELSGCVVETGGGGKHIYYRLDGATRLMGHHKDYPGIDFKNGTAGASFVVGAGSLHASGGVYEFDKGNPDDLTDCPPPLVALLERKETKNKSYEGVEVTNDEIQEIIKVIPNRDEHYDEWIKVGMALHDTTGGSQEGLNLWHQWSMQSAKYNPELMDQRWHSFGKSSNPVRVGTLFRMAFDEGYIRPVTFDDAGDPPPTVSNEDDDEPQQPKPKHVRMLEALLADDDAEMARISNMPWLIDGLIPAETFGVVFGEPGCGKSFTMVDMACSVASGHQWQGMDTGDEGIVIYVSAEGGNGMRFRKRAWEQVNRRAPLMRVMPMATIMDDPKDVGSLTQVLREYKRRIDQPIKMVVIDTLNRSMAGNENDNSDMADFVRGCEQIQSDHSCGVVVVHHSGKDAERGARGASALKAATDFEIMVGKKEDIITVTHTRAKDSEPLAPVVCRAEVVTIEGYVDYKGRPITSLVPMPANFSDEMRASATMSPLEKTAMAIISELCGDAGVCDRDDAREKFSQETGRKGESLRTGFTKTLSKLRDRGAIEYDRDDIRIDGF